MKEQFDYNLIVTQLTKIIAFWQSNLSQIGLMPLVIFGLALLVIYLKNSRLISLRLSFQKIKLGLAVLQIAVLIISNPGVAVIASEATESAKVLSEATTSAKLEKIGLDSETVAKVAETLNIDSTQTTSKLTDKIDSALNSLNSESKQVQSAVEKITAKLNKLAKKTWKANEKITALVSNPQNNKLSIEVIDPKGQVLGLSTEEIDKSHGTQLRISPKSSFTPGKYTLKVTDTVTGTSSTQDFSWGVLALNTDRSMYLPNQTVQFAFGILDEKGLMVCDSNVMLRIQNAELNIDDELSTENGMIKVNPECSVKDITTKPDYETAYQVGGVGIYELTLTAKTKNGSYTINDSIEVRSNVAFDVVRNSATRIYPVKSYPMVMDIIANQDFEGTVSEIVPESFGILPLEEFEEGSLNELATQGDKVREIQGLTIENKKEIKKDSSVVQFKKVDLISAKVLEQQNVLGASVSLGMPVKEIKVTNEFGEQIDDKQMGKKYSDFGVAGHDGIDFEVKVGTEVLATDDGEVILASENSDYGTTVVLQHAWGKSYYGHLSNTVAKKGQEVKRGELIALSGNTGLSSAPHLHFGIKPTKNDKDNGYYGKIDPSSLLGLDLASNVLSATNSNVPAESVKAITWHVSLKKGERVKLGYTYKAPEISPQFYTAGPLTFFDTKKTEIFREERKWQIASDDVTTYTINFVSDVEGFAWTSTSCSGTCTNGWVNDGNPAGGVYNKVTGRNSASQGYFSKSLSWETMGVPSGAYVTGVNGSFDYKQFQETHAATQSMGLMLYDSANSTNILTPSADLETSFDPTTTSASWANRDTDSSKNVASSYQASNTSIMVRMLMNAASGANNSASTEIRADKIVLTLTYQLPFSTITQRQGIIENDQNGTNLTSHTAQIGERMKVKLQIDTDGSLPAYKVFKLQYDKSDNSWIDVKSSEEIRPALSASVIGTGVLGAGDSGACTGTTKYSGYIYENSAVTESIKIYGGGCQEIGFVVDTKNATASTTYRFRLLMADASDFSQLSSYAAYPSFTTVSSVNNTKRYSASNTTSLTNLGVGLAGYWKLDENSGLTIDCSTKPFTDSSGNGNNGASCPSTTGPDGGATGRFGNGVTFDGSDDYISMSDNAALDPSDELTVSAWVKFTQTPSTRGEDAMIAIKKDSGSPSYSYRLFVNSTGNNVCFYWVNSSNTEYGRCVSGTVNALAAGNWYHVVGQKIGSRIAIYINGSLPANHTNNPTLTGTLKDGNGELSLGSELGTQNRINGTLDDIRIYNRALTTDDISALSQGISESYPDMKNLLDKSGYDNVNSDDATREILQNVTSDTTADLTPVGGATGNKFGVSVANAGDVNGDGYQDIIIGEESYNPGAAANSGRALIYFGGPIMDTISDVTLSSSNGASSFFGHSVSSAGDINGDGYADVIVGDYFNAQVDGFVYYGGASMNTTIDVNFADSSATVTTSVTVASAGDVNGDGYSDVILANPSNNNNTGTVNIFYGGTSPDQIPDVSVTGSASNQFFGYAISSAGDVNGDMYTDVIIGAYGTTNGNAYIFNGGSSMNNTSDATLAGVTSGDQFGRSVSYAGDVNGDGFADVIVGATARTTSTGAAYVYYGGSGAFNTTADYTLAGEATNNFFGRSVSTVGDVNGDGYSDFIVGADGNGTSNTGEIYVYYGGASVNTTADITQTGESTSNFYGSSVAEAGDVNGDGFPDIVVGAYGNNSSTGKAYIYYQSYSTNNSADRTWSGDSSNANLGYFVANAGDVNGDGYSDVVAGAAQHAGGGANRGQAYIFYGGSKFSTTAAVTMSGDDDGGFFGTAVAGAGDVNGDGYADVIISAPNHDVTGTERGRAYIYFGGANMDNTADVTLSGDENTGYFGQSVGGGGDVNGDGYADVVVGAYMHDADSGLGADRGRIYIYYGGSSMDNTADVTVSGDENGANLGWSASGAGDVNGDGLFDLIIGAHKHNATGTDRGRAYIFYGGLSTMDGTADVTLSGDEDSGQFGYSVSLAGDVNGDGFADVIAGARLHNGGSTDRGRAYIYYGGSNMNNAVDVTFTGDEDSAQLGYAVSGAGDVNGDGYSDVIAGAYTHDAGGTSAADRGRAYIYYGGMNMDITSDLTVSGDEDGAGLGWSLSNAGDLNNDGYGDVIVSAPFHDAGVASSNRGISYVYLGGTSTFYPVYNFASKSASACSGLTSIAGTWGGQTNLAPSTKNIKLQIYRFGSSNTWEDLGSDTSATTNSDISVTGSKSASLSEYCDGSNWAYFRTYQDVGTQTHQTDNFSATFTGSGGAETPTVDKLMRHGRWFNSSGVVQPFTF